MPKNSKVFLDITIGPKASGRIVIELFSDLTPFTAENFRGLCTGDYGTSASGNRLFYLDSLFHRISPKEYCVGGDFVAGTGKCGESIYGGAFPDEDFTRRHSQAGVVSSYTPGPNANTSLFLITFGSVPSLDSRFVVFGQVVEGMHVVRDIQKVPIDANDRPLCPVRIFNCGEIEDGREHIKFEEFKEQLNIYRAYAEKKAQRKDEHMRKYREMMQRRASGLPQTEADSQLERSVTLEPVGEDAGDMDECEETEAQVASTIPKSLQDRMDAVKQRLKHIKRLNEEAVVVPATAGKTTKRQEWEADNQQVEAHLDEIGLGADKKYLLDNISKVKTQERKKKKKAKSASFGWEMFNEDAVLKAYHRRLGKLKFDPKLYAAAKGENEGGKEGEVVGEKEGEKDGEQAEYIEPPPERVEAMAQELEAEQKHRKKFSRHRPFYEDMDINFVNERNRVYNKKLERHFSQYVSDIKSSLERGTAL